jgi:hypothetical protein
VGEDNITSLLKQNPEIENGVELGTYFTNHKQIPLDSIEIKPTTKLGNGTTKKQARG